MTISPYFLRLVHQATFFALLLTIVLIPAITEMTLLSALVILPSLLVFIFALHIMIDESINKLISNNANKLKKQKCSNKYCILLNCLSH
ncbi:MAG: hypothetical protein OCD00_04620 [Colwellia sp.]